MTDSIQNQVEKINQTSKELGELARALVTEFRRDVKNFPIDIKTTREIEEAIRLDCSLLNLALADIRVIRITLQQNGEHNGSR